MSADDERLADLAEISRLLTSRRSLRGSLTQVFDLLESRHQAMAGAVFVREDGREGLVLVAAHGLSGAAVGRRVRYQLGEGITGRVFESGRPVVVPQVSREPLFLDKSGVFRGSRASELSFVCTPIVLDSRPVGTLGVAYRYRRERRLEAEKGFLAVVAGMIAQAVRVEGLVHSERQRALEESSKLRDELRERHALANMIGRSRAMQEVAEQVARVASTSTTVLIRGESGTGKEMVAQAIHYGSPRSSRPLIKVNCGALPEPLIESELFGYEKGAFTDAQARKKGRFELANGGTLFLDEVGDLSAATQVKLLRVLQEREFERLGGVHPVKVDVRLIAATNKDLELAVGAGTFREDLYYRLNVYSVYLPPLRERQGDVVLLADHFVEKYSSRHGKVVKRIATSAIDVLTAYHWPGNVRELENCIERAVLVCEGGVIHAHHLPPSLQTAEVSGTLPRQSLDTAVAAVEKDLILDALKSARGNRARAARLLDTTERIIGYKVRKYGIDARRFRAGRS